MQSGNLFSSAGPGLPACGRPTARRLAPLLVILAAALGCGEDATSPGSPKPTEPRGLSAGAAAGALAFRQISAGHHQTCGLTTDNRAYCWGSGWLGDGGISYVQKETPVAVVGGIRFRQISAGNSHACGVTFDDRAFCWGSNDFGQLGEGTDRNVVNSPVPVAGGLSFRQVRAGGVHTCGVTTADGAYCWGAGFSGQLGDGTTDQHRTPVAVAGGLRFRQVFAGFLYTCGATTGNRAYCWGDNTEGQLGIGTSGRRHGTVIPVAVAGGHNFRQVITGTTATTGVGEHTCGVTTADRAYCWGGNDNGQLGDGTRTRRSRPVAVLGGQQFSAVHPGGRHTCATTTGGRGFCWGWNREGELGDGTITNRLTPVAVTGGLQFTGLSAGGFHTCGVATDDRAYCWGSNSSSQLGDGTTTQRRRPAAVAGPM